MLPNEHNKSVPDMRPNVLFVNICDINNMKAIEPGPCSSCFHHVAKHNDMDDLCPCFKMKIIK